MQIRELIQQSGIDLINASAIQVKLGNIFTRFIKSISGILFLDILETPLCTMICKFAIIYFDFGLIFNELCQGFRIFNWISIQPQNFEVQVLHFFYQFLFIRELVGDEWESDSVVGELQMT